MHHALAREDAAAIVDQRATERAFIEPRRNLIGKACEHATRDRARRGFPFLDLETFNARDGEKLFPELARFPRCAGIDSQVERNAADQSDSFPRNEKRAGE